MPVSPPVAPVDADAFRTAVLGWYAVNGRRLNFRRRRDPYAVLVSEAMAQQTQISRVEPSWEAFLARFESVEDLAAAPTADVLRAWQGMGYNRRALNLQRAARVIVTEHGGRFPESVEALERLPGVGPYTARAVAAIAFGARVGAVDTNVRRVLGRVIGGWDGLAPAELQAAADNLVPDGRAGEWTHALMDVGARFCRPRRPTCGECPARAWCAAADDAASGPGAHASAAPSASPDPSARPRRSAVPVRSADTSASHDPSEGPGRPAASRRPDLPVQSAPSGASVPFRSTSRWLRGRLVDLARAAGDDGWIAVDRPLEPHDLPAVLVAARALAREGLLELLPSDPPLIRLPR